MLRKSLLAKILVIVISITIAGFALLIYEVISEEEKKLLEEKAKAGEFLTKPILHSIYKDMLDERAEMVRYLMEGMKTIDGVERVQIIRGNGVEEAFQDFKTLRAVEEEYGDDLPLEWTDGHPDKEKNVARGIDNPRFKELLAEFHGGRKEGAYYTEKEEGKRLLTYLVPINKRPKCKACHVGEGARGVLMVTTSLEELYAGLASSRIRWILYSIFIVTGVSVLLTLLVRKIITNPIKETADMLHDIAEGNGDLTRRLEVSSKDEIGTLSRWFNAFIEGLHEIIKDIFSGYKNISKVSNNIKDSSVAVKNSAHTQMQAIEMTSSSIQEMNSSIQSIASEAEEQMKSTEDASAAILQMLSANSEVAENSDQLTESVERTASSINQIAATIKEVAQHVDALFMKTEEVVSATTEINSAVSEVLNHEKERVVLAEKVKEDATNLGMEAVNKTTLGMEKIKEEVSLTADIINRLEERSGEIGRIVGVIEDVTETTNLLSLNAAIIAAQAGEHGKGFAVVANEVKDLAKKTATSTSEITNLINLVQQEVTAAKRSMDNSSQSVEEGTRLSEEARKALEKITVSAEASLDMARKVEIATSEQTKVLGSVTEAIQKINVMVEEIKRATDEQKSSSEEILGATEDMRDNTEVVRRSTLEQAKESDHIQKIITNVAENMQTIARATREQKSASQIIVESVETVKEEVEKNVALSADMEEMVSELDTHNHHMKEKVESFKI